MRYFAGVLHYLSDFKCCYILLFWWCPIIYFWPSTIWGKLICCCCYGSHSAASTFYTLQCLATSIWMTMSFHQRLREIFKSLVFCTIPDSGPALPTNWIQSLRKESLTDFLTFVLPVNDSFATFGDICYRFKVVNGKVERTIAMIAAGGLYSDYE